MSVSLRDVAAKAGVSINTVSSVMNSKTSARISPETQRRVRRIADEMGYRPNLMARSLITRRTNMIGVITSGWRNAYYHALLDTAEAVISEAGYQTMTEAGFIEGRDSEAERHKLHGWPVDAVMMLGYVDSTPEDYLGSVARARPVVFAGGVRPRTDDDCVWLDTASGARDAINHLVRQGHRRLAHVAPEKHMLGATADPRHATYRQVCAGAGLTLETIGLGAHGETRKAGWLVGQEIAARGRLLRPEAILCHNDDIAIGILHGLARGGVRVPDDIAVVGFDGIEEGSYLPRPLTTVQMPIEVTCRRALEMVLDRLNGNPDAPPRHEVIPTHLVIRETA